LRFVQGKIFRCKYTNRFLDDQARRWFMDVLDAIRSRRAVRKFADRPVAAETIDKILDAGRRSQSSKNTQPWKFILIEDKARLEALSKLGTYAGHLAGAAFAVVLVGAKAWNWNDFDLGQAAAYMQLAAWDLEVGACIAAIYPEAEVKALLDIPAEWTVYCALSFGYPAEDWEPARMGGRHPISEVVYREKWG
jgi:nitroreductase